jgi:hypothetical protein
VLEFTACLRCLAEADDGSAFVLMTLSSAFQGMAAEDPNLRRLAALDGVYLLAAPTEDEFAQMIRLPALAAGLRFEEKNGVPLDERIIRDARSQPDCLPLVELCLEELTSLRGGKPLLTFEDYEALGTISGVLASRANEALASLSPAQQQAIDVVLPALVNRDPNQLQVAVRRTASWREVAPTAEAEALVEGLAKARLLVIDSDGAGEPRVSVVHEALLRHWEPAQRWIGLDDNQDFLRRRERFEQSYRNYQTAPPTKRRDFLLPRGIQLAEAQDLIEKHPHAFEQMREFVQLSAWEYKKRRLLLYALAGAAALIAFWGYSSYVSLRLRDVEANQLLA